MSKNKTLACPINTNHKTRKVEVLSSGPFYICDECGGEDVQHLEKVMLKSLLSNGRHAPRIILSGSQSPNDFYPKSIQDFVRGISSNFPFNDVHTSSIHGNMHGAFEYLDENGRKMLVTRNMHFSKFEEFQDWPDNDKQLWISLEKEINDDYPVFVF